MKIEFVLDERVAEHFGEDVAEDAPDGLWVPVIFCEECSDAVGEGEEALVLFRTDPGTERGLVRVVHRRCVEEFLREGTGAWKEESLRLLPVQIANVLNADPTVVYDLAEREWSPELEIIGIAADGAGPAGVRS